MKTPKIAGDNAHLGAPQEGEQEAAQLGAVYYITKPLEYDTLIAAVRSTLDRAEYDNLDNIVIATHGRVPELENAGGRYQSGHSNSD